MPMILNPRFALLFLVALPALGGAVVHPHGASAFVMGAWAGFLISAPPLFVMLWVFGMRSLAQIVRPLIRMPIIIGLSALVLYLSGTQIGLGGQMLGAGAMLWWMRRKSGAVI